MTAILIIIINDTLILILYMYIYIYIYMLFSLSLYIIHTDVVPCRAMPCSAAPGPARTGPSPLKAHMRNLLGWLGTRLAQITLHSICSFCYFEIIKAISRKFKVFWASLVPNQHTKFLILKARRPQTLANFALGRNSTPLNSSSSNEDFV